MPDPVWQAFLEIPVIVSNPVRQRPGWHGARGFGFPAPGHYARSKDHVLLLRQRCLLLYVEAMPDTHDRPAVGGMETHICVTDGMAALREGYVVHVRPGPREFPDRMGTGRWFWIACRAAGAVISSTAMMTI